MEAERVESQDTSGTIQNSYYLSSKVTASSTTVTLGTAISGDTITVSWSNFMDDLTPNINNGNSILSWQTENDKLNLLNLNKSDSDMRFVEDTNNINNGYPILAWQVE